MLDLFVCLFGLRLYAPVNNFSVMSGRSHHFLGITSTISEVNASCSRIQHGECWICVVAPQMIIVRFATLVLTLIKDIRGQLDIMKRQFRKQASHLSQRVAAANQIRKDFGR